MKAILLALTVAISLASVTTVIASEHPASIFDKLRNSAP